MSAQTIPAFDLKPCLDAAEPQWRANLESMFARMHFILGEQVAAFEREFAGAMGARHAIGVGTGTAALELCLREGRVPAGGEVITSAITAPFTAIAILAAGGKPKFADVDAETLLVDPDDLANRITRKTAALIPVHLYGQACNLLKITAVARLTKKVLIQDACQAHGLVYRGRPLTEFSPYVAYSFYPTKNLGCLGDGGAILTNRGSSAGRLRSLRDGGRRGDQVAHVPGINSRLDEMQACYLRAFLTHLEDWNARRAAIAAMYDQAFESCEAVRPVLRNAPTVNHLYVVRVKRRDRLREWLGRRGISTGIHYATPLHLHPAFSECGLKRGDLPRAEKACREILSLPIWPYMPESAACRVAESILQFIDQ